MSRGIAHITHSPSLPGLSRQSRCGGHSALGIEMAGTSPAMTVGEVTVGEVTAGAVSMTAFRP